MQSLKQAIQKFHQDENGSESVEMAVLFPILLLLVGFIIDRFIQYEGLTMLSSAANEAIRSAVIADSEDDASKRIKEILSDRLKTSNMGWCSGETNNTCKAWGDDVSSVKDRSQFESNKQDKLLITTDKGWCNGSYITLGVRAHKSSIMPSYESFKRLLTTGGPIYHQHTYIIKARVESKDKCK